MKPRNIFKAVALGSALTIASSTAVMAAIPGNSVIIGSKAYDVTLLFSNEYTAQINSDIAVSNGILYYNLGGAGWKDIMSGNVVTNEQMALLPQVTYLNKDKEITIYQEGDGDPVVALAVESVSAINSTQISVTFEGVAEAVTIDLAEALVEGENEVTFEYEGQTFTATVTYTATDTEAPVLVYDGETTFDVVNGAEFTAPVVTATDNKDEAVVVTKVIKNAAGDTLEAIDTKVAGTYTITYSAVDAAGNAAENKVVTVNVAEAPLAIQSVSAINATTVQVELSAAAVTAPVASDFVVKVDGAPVNVSAVAKAANTTKTYNLTVATLNNKEGVLEVNGKVAAISGSDFGYDFKAPAVASVLGIDKNHVEVTFSEKVDKTTAEITANYDVTKLDETTLTVALATLQADGKTVLLTTTTAMDTFANGYIAKVDATAATPVKDAKGNVVAATIKSIFSGIGQESTQGPVALSALYDPSTTKTIKVTFDKNIATATKAKIQVGGVALALADTVSTAGNTLTITLSTASATAFETAANKVVTFEEGALKDTATIPNSIAASTVTVVEAAKLLTATYVEDTNILVLNFSSPVQTAKLDLAKIEVNAQVITGGTVKETGNSATVTIDLTAAGNLNLIEAAVATNRKVEVKASVAKNLDANGNAIAQAVYATNLTYTDDVVAPTFTSATVNATTKKMILTFSEPVTNTTANMVEIYNDTTKLFDLSSGADVASVTPIKNTLEVVLNSGAGPVGIDKIKAVADKSKLSAKVLKTTSGGTEAVKDAAGNKFGTTADTSVSLSYADQDAVKYVSTSQTGLSTNQVKVTFDKSIVAADLSTAKFTVVKSDNSTVTVPVTKVIGSDGNRQIILTLDDTSANFVVGYTYIVKTTALDIYANPVETTYTNASFTLATSTATAYKLSTAVYADANADFTVNAGDKITLTFDGVVSTSGDVTSSDFVLGGGGTPSLGNFAIAAGSAPEQLVITLGTGTSLTLATTTLNITATAADKHIVGANGSKVDAAVGAITLAKVDSTPPTISKAVFTDTVNDGLLGDGDTLLLSFNENIKLIDATTLDEGDFVVTVGGTTLDLKANQVVVDGKTVTVILDGISNNTIPGTSKIDVSGGVDSISDLWGNVAAAGTPVVIEKSDKTAPKFTNVTYIKGTGKTSTDVEATDKIVLQLDEAAGFAANAIPDNVFVLYKGTTAVAIDLSANNNGTDNKAVVSISNSGKTLTITLGTANAGTELATTPISTLTSFNVDASKTKTAKDANGNLLAPVVGFGIEVAK